MSDPFYAPARGAINVRSTFNAAVHDEEFPTSDWKVYQWEIASVTSGDFLFLFSHHDGPLGWAGPGMPHTFKEPESILLSFGFRRIRGSNVAESFGKLLSPDEKKAAEPLTTAVSERAYYEWNLVLRSSAETRRWTPGARDLYSKSLRGTSGDITESVPANEFFSTRWLKASPYLTLTSGDACIERWAFLPANVNCQLDDGELLPDSPIKVRDKVYTEAEYPAPIWRIRLRWKPGA